MATKDFKVRNGLIVGGTLTLGGNVVSKVLDSDAVTAIAGSGSNVVHSIGGDSDQAFSKLDTQLNAAGTPVSIGDIAYVEGASSVAYVATGTPSVFTGSHSLTIGSTAPSGDQRIIIDGLKISPLTAITASANNNTTSNIRLTGAVLTASNTAAAFPAGDSGAFCGWQPNLTLNIPGEGSARTGVHCLVVMKPNTVPTYDGAAYAFTATIAGIIPVSNTGSTTPTDIRGNFYSWTSGLTTTNISISQSGASYGLFPATLGSSIAAQWTKISNNFDSDQIVTIINENTTAGSIDSDVAAVAQLRRDADSDNIRIQEIATSLEQINELVDSDLKAIADLRNDLDSETARISGLGVTVTEVTDSDGREAIASPAEGDIAVQFRAGSGTNTGISYDFSGGQLWSKTNYLANGTLGLTYVTASDVGNGRFKWSHATFNDHVQKGDVIVVENATVTSSPGVNPWASKSGTLLFVCHTPKIGSTAPWYNMASYFYIQAQGTSGWMNTDISGYFGDTGGTVNTTNPRGAIPASAQMVHSYGNVNNSSTTTSLSGGVATLYRMFSADTYQDAYDTSGGSASAYADHTGNAASFFEKPLVYIHDGSNFKTYVQDQILATIDSDYVANIVNDNTSASSIDSDVAAVAQLRRDADSDSIRIQEIATSLEQINELVDSDLKAIGDLRNDVDSDSIRIQDLQTQISSIGGLTDSDLKAVADLRNDVDSDSTKLQALQVSVDSLAGTAAINTTVYTYTATQGQTTFTGTDANGLTLAYAPGKIYVFLNGVLILDTTDYTATNGTSIVLQEAADSDNTVQIIKHVGTVQIGFDSDQVVAIINENVVSGSVDSDVAAIAALRRDADSDSIRIQKIATQDDSDRNAGHLARVFRITSTSELDTLNTNNGLGTRTGVARVGDIAYIANPFKAYVLTNIYSAASYQNTGFHVQTNNGTVTRMFFDVVPAGQLPSENFAVGTLIATNSGGGDQRTVTAVSDTGGNYSKGYLDFTPSDSGYAPGWDNKTVWASSADQTTWQKFSFDSDHVAQIISEAGVGGFDSDQVVSIVNENSGVNFIVANNGSAAYTFTGNGFPSGVDNPTLYLKRGHTYRFKLAVTGHPFEIRLSSSGSAYSSGVTNNSAQTGVTTFTVPMDAPDTLVYQCTLHSGMVGTIKIGRQGFDSDQIVAIINENTTAGSIDSDVAAIAALRRDADSDNIRIQEIATSLEQINELVDSDLKAIADLRNDVDSDSIKLQALQETVAGLGSGGSGSGMTDSDLKVVADLRNEVDALNLSAGTIDQNATFTTFKYKTTNGQTTISGVDRDNQTLSYVAGSINVFLNGVLLNDSDDYTASNGSSVVLQLAADSDDVVVIQKVASTLDSETVQSIWNDNYQALDISRYDFTAIQNQTTFTGADDNGSSLNYTTNKIQVYLNGILLLRTTDYTDTSGTSIVLTQAADSDDKLSIIKYIGQTATENLTITRFTYGFGDAGNGAVGTTTLTGADDNGNSLSYEVGKIQVFSNGVLLEDSDDYIANTGTSVILQQGADSDDKISIIKYNGAIQRVDGVGFDSDQVVAIVNENASSGTTTLAPTDSDYTSSAGQTLIMDTSSWPRTVTLPSSASLGDLIRVIDGTGSAATNVITINRNGHKLLGGDSDMSININRSGISLIYYNTAQGWILQDN